MKRNYKTYVEPVTFLLTTILILLVMLTPVLVGYLLVVEGEITDLSGEDSLWFYVLALILLTCDMAALLVMAPRGWATITLYDDKVTWRAPFRKSVTLKFDDIKYAGMDFSNASLSKSVGFEKAETLYVSAYIYLSTLPYFPKRGKEFKKVYNEDGIIMFKYTEKLCPALVEKLPEDVVRSLKDFDNMIKKQYKKKLKNKE